MKVPLTGEEKTPLLAGALTLGLLGTALAAHAIWGQDQRPQLLHQGVALLASPHHPKALAQARDLFRRLAQKSPLDPQPLLLASLAETLDSLEHNPSPKNHPLETILALVHQGNIAGAKAALASLNEEEQTKVDLETMAWFLEQAGRLRPTQENP